MANYSIVLSNKANYGAIGDLSLSGNKTAWSMSVWVKFVSGDTGIAVMGNNKSSTGTGGSSILFDSLQQAEMMAENIAFAPALSPSAAADGVFGLIAPAVSWVDDGHWHNIVGTYNGNYQHYSVTSVVNSTRLNVTGTTNLNVGDRIYQTFYSSVITAISPGVSIDVVSTTNFTSSSTNGANNFVTAGVHLYLDGVEITTFVDYEFSLFFSAYSCNIPFGIGDSEHLNYHSRLGKYAYPACYLRILSAAEAATIAAGNNIATGAAGQWLFTEGTGLTAADSSGNARTLTFNAVSWDTDVPFGNGVSAKVKASTSLVF